MIYKMIIVSMVGQNPSGIMSSAEAMMNTASVDGYRFVHGFESDNRVYIVMGKSLEKRGRPRKDNEEVVELEG
jgi:hypothetical protein